MSYHWRSEVADDDLMPPAAVDSIQQTRVINLRKTDIGGQMRSITVRLVEVGSISDEACSLINERYVKKGYGTSHRIPSSAHHATFTAELDGETVGTITLGVDSNNRLAADNTFRTEIDGLRSQRSAHLCELTKFAFAAGFHSRQVMASLFHIVFVYGSRNFGCTDLLIEVHRKHARFYETMLGFERLGEPRTNASVNASLQLMRISVAKIREHITAASDALVVPNRTLYSLFFPTTDEDGIYNRLMLAGDGDRDLFGRQHIKSVPFDSETQDISVSNDASLAISRADIGSLNSAAYRRPDGRPTSEQLKALLLENAQLCRLLRKTLLDEEEAKRQLRM